MFYNPPLLGTDTSEHSNKIIYGMKNEFTVKYFLIIIGDYYVFWKELLMVEYTCQGVKVDMRPVLPHNLKGTPQRIIQ